MMNRIQTGVYICLSIVINTIKNNTTKSKLERKFGRISLLTSLNQINLEYDNYIIQLCQRIDIILSVCNNKTSSKHIIHYFVLFCIKIVQRDLL